MLSLIKYESYRSEKSYIDLKAPPTQYFLIKFRLITKTLISIIVGKGLIGLITSTDFNRLSIDLKLVIINFLISADSQP